MPPVPPPNALPGPNVCENGAIPFSPRAPSRSCRTAVDCRSSFSIASSSERLRCHYRLDVVAGHELDVVHGEHVRGVGHGDCERCARTATAAGSGTCAPSPAGIILMTPASTSKCSRLIEGTPYWRDSRLVISSSRTKPMVTRTRPSFAPEDFCWLRASWSWVWLTRFSLSSSSPIFMGTPARPLKMSPFSIVTGQILCRRRGRCQGCGAQVDFNGTTHLASLAI